MPYLHILYFPAFAPRHLGVHPTPDAGDGKRVAAAPGGAIGRACGHEGGRKMSGWR
jgi:hypothetical protein